MKILQKLPADSGDKTESFQRFVIKERKELDFPLLILVIKPQCFFDFPANRTVEERGAKTVNVRTTDHEKTHFSTVLVCMTDGTKLTPMVIFKQKTMPKNAFLSGLIVHVHDEDWMDKAGVLIWLKECWTRRPGGGLTNNRSFLVWDQFRAHVTDKVKNRTKNGCNNGITVIPGCLTTILQPLDVSLNHSCKQK